jgi:hypothetical protein
MFLAVTCQHASGACQSHSRPVLNLREASRKYVELSPSTPLFLTLRFYEKDLTPTPNLLRISGRYSLRSGISFQIGTTMSFCYPLFYSNYVKMALPITHLSVNRPSRKILARLLAYTTRLKALEKENRHHTTYGLSSQRHRTAHVCWLH